ncbi:MAG: hypothetical protein ABFD98_07285 [Syntrophobacteraceae bacterium]|nr:hypothetical protein [Desulfobacteraceae bacterium]
MNIEADMNNECMGRALSLVADYYDTCKYGCEGNEGYRKSTDLGKLASCLGELAAAGIVDRERTVFADLGCADGRVNVLAGYFVKCSIGVEIDGEILAEYDRRRKELERLLTVAGLGRPPENVTLFRGSSLEPETFRKIGESTGFGFADIDLFYTYIILHDLFAKKIASESKPGALYLVYGFSRVLPRYEGLELVEPDVAGRGVAALYRAGR